MRRRVAGSANNSAPIASYAAFFAAVVALLALLAAPTRAQETTNVKSKEQSQEATTSDVSQANETAAQTSSSEDEYESATQVRAQTDGQELAFAEGVGVRAISRAGQPVGGPLVGTRVDTRSTDDNDRFVEIIRIPGSTCRAEEGASFDLRDEDGTQATFTDRTGADSLSENVRIKETRAGLRVTSDAPNGTSRNNNIRPINERGSDNDLDTGGLKIVSSTDIICREDSTANTGGASGIQPNGDVAAADENSDAVDNLLALDCEDLLERLRDREEGQYADLGFADPAVEDRVDECREQEVINDTSPGEDLPDTGGLPLLGLAVFGLASVIAGASVIRGVGRGE